MDLSKNDLPTLIRTQDHLNVLRYIRVFELRESELVVKHGKAWLGDDLSKSGGVNTIVRQTALEQIAFAALDTQQPKLAETSLDRLKASGVPPDSIRFRRLLARCLEASGDKNGATLIYDDLTQDTETPANLSALKRLYALEKAQPANEPTAQGVLVKYLQKHPTDSAAWYELAQARKALGDFNAAAYCLEECMLSSPLEATLHVELAECWMTYAMGGASNKNKMDSPLPLLLQARQHMAQALELDGSSTRAAWGLLQCSNLYLLESGSGEEDEAKAAADPFQDEVAQALVEHAAAILTKNYQGTPMEAPVKRLVKEFL
mmetsp:Transcript_8213/g.17121  ORF Transcript_8213/g.17121 Transcript_8213/m.17121 type:complete len:319 (-) Transcript_8213:33-989(-)|eukprot:CAMPEP_0172459196 /NCGR_PEP_ID=MMETSP1065-20121228/31482_1 /TAXON_ID=265537 /ORGANISM="Amphiprora paludosa, Strain CCMP125" /LENGTH=318 /DNA_ID=CAMNT_0013213793 /DNA_START=38 /DNA_END=994 /DNA_ORIENTATION=-